MLQNELFTFTAPQADGNLIKTNIQLNPSHPIFEGHFPGQPILPGVCMLQMVKEVLEAAINNQTRLLKAAELKFLVIVAPEQDKVIQMELKVTDETELLRVEARLLDDSLVLFKFKGTFAALPVRLK